MSAARGIYAVIIQHVAKAAIHKSSPRCRRLTAKTQDSTLGFAAEVPYILGDDFSFLGERARAYAHAQRIEQAFLGQLDEFARQIVIA